MSGGEILIIIIIYFLLLLVIAYFTSRNSDNQTFFIGNKRSPWYLVAFGMIGASMSGVTFMSIPGKVGVDQFSYMQIVFGYMLGYLVIALILLPIYYKLNLISIYKYLEQRFGIFSYKTGAFYFILSKIVGAGFRLFLVASVLQLFVFSTWDIPFWVTVAITLGFILLYTFRGGIRTIVWTDTLQTFFMLTALILTVYLISSDLNLSFSGLVTSISGSDYSKIFVLDWNSDKFFLKHFIGGALIAMTMTGLDQDMMQKNLSIRNLKESQRNIYSQMGMYIVFNLIFLSLGALLYMYALNQYDVMTAGLETLPDASVYPNKALMFLADEKGLSEYTGNKGNFRSDFLYPLLAIKYLGPVVAITFVIGLIAAAYSSADSALTALTTSFCVDFLNFKKGEESINIRYLVHFSFTFVMFLTILLFNLDKSGAVIDKVFTAAGYTYGPLLGLFAFGIFTKRKVRDILVPVICIIAPVAIYFIKANEKILFGSYVIGFELLLYNGLLTFIGLLLISTGKRTQVTVTF